jgi:hypothetical protein
MQFPDFLRTFIVESKSCVLYSYNVLVCVKLYHSPLRPDSFRIVQQNSLNTWKSRLPENTTTASKAISGNLSAGMEEKITVSALW